jgi:hypothetical protein
MPLQETSGAATYDAFGGGPAVAAKYIEDYFQTWLRTGTGASATVTTGLNASINKSLVWTKSRSAATDHKLTDTVRGATKALVSNSTAAETTDSQGLTAFSSTGYTIGTNTTYNNSGATYVDWQFVATPKFFDVVTYTGDGNTSRTIAHSLGSTPGCVIVKRTSNTGNWNVWHRSANGNLQLNSTSAETDFNNWYPAGMTSTTFGVAEVNTGNTNDAGSVYVAYLFAHDAGGFGASGTDNVISCGSYTGNGSATGPVITLGYEPQWVLVKRTSAAGTDWYIIDNMRSMATVNSDGSALLRPNTSAAESTSNPGGTYLWATSTGFQIKSTDGEVNSSSQTYIYIAIRRGPMRTPTTGTSVFEPVAYTGTAAAATLGSLPVNDLSLFINRSGTTLTGSTWYDRLRGAGRYILSSNTNAEGNDATTVTGFDTQQGVRVGTDNEGTVNATTTYVLEQFRRAPGFFDVVCYTGNGSTQTINHNLTVKPELIIIKVRSRSVTGWRVTYSMGATTYNQALLESTGSGSSSSYGSGSNLNAEPTASVFSVGNVGEVNFSAATFVAYLFATVAGVSKVGSYTGTGTTLQVNCGFTGGSRFVLIKRTDSTGDWYVWDSARGIVAGNDPYLLLNSTAAEVTGTDYIDTFSSGFEISSTAPAAINANGGTFIFLAIA